MFETLRVTGSTNADLAARLAAGEQVPEGFWLLADRQTAGKGRLGRVWDDGAAVPEKAGNFMGSTAVALIPQDPSAGSLALVAGLAVQQAVAPYVAPPHMPLLKWPNDVMVGGAKLAGILLERVRDHVIVGIGVNLASAPEIAGRETCALARFGPAPDRDSFAVALVGHFADELARWRRFGIEALLARWQAAAHPLGTPLAVSQSDGSKLAGIFAGLDATGALRLALPDGTCQTVHAGDVSLA